MSITAPPASRVPGFYVTGGTLGQDAPSYVERQADQDLYDGLQRGEFCYVLTSRQMGKSSLMGATAVRLRREGVGVVVIDLTLIGQNLSAEQWYNSLLERIGQHLHLEEELEEYWAQQNQRSPLQRWLGALAEVVLARHPGPVVIFVDEIDAVRSLPFSTDEFFAAIRACYNRRTEEPEWQRLTFCLLGVATPSDLIQDTRTTPFNIGRRIELTDFTPLEAAPLARGLGRNQPLAHALLARVLYWTAGHPYLSQRLCQAVAVDESVRDTAGVDRLCQELFFTPRARERDDNLLFVRDRVLRSEADRASLLSLYLQVRGQKVPDDETNPLVSVLRLSGIVREEEGYLHARNRIYARVFDRRWVEANLPDAELRRLRDAAREEARKRRQAEDRERVAHRYLYAAQIKLAQLACEAAHPAEAEQLLAAQRPDPGREDLRGFEWRYLWHLAHRDDAQSTLHTGQDLFSLAFSPDGRMIATCGFSNWVKLWDAGTHRLLAQVPAFAGGVAAVAFSPDSRLLAGLGSVTRSLNSPTEVKLWEPNTGRLAATWKVHDRVGMIGNLSGVGGVAFSPDGRRLAAASGPRVRMWDLAAERELGTLPEHSERTHCLAFSPDGRLLATADRDGIARLWSVGSRRVVAELGGHSGGAWSVAFAPDGKSLAVGSSANGTVKLWDLVRREVLATLVGRGTRTSVAYSPDGTKLATTGLDYTVQLWDPVTKEEVTTFYGHQGHVSAAVFSPDGDTLASASADRTVKLWHSRPAHADLLKLGSRAVAISRDGARLLTREGTQEIRLWNQVEKRVIGSLQWRDAPITDMVLSPDGHTVAIASQDDRLRFWDAAAGRISLTLESEPTRMFHATGSFSPDGRSFAYGLDRRSVGLWDLVTRQKIAAFTGHDGFCAPISVFSPNGKLLATGSHDLTAKLWDLVTRQEVATFKGHKSWTGPLTFSPDSKLLATVSGSDQVVNIWSLAGKRKLAALKGHDQQIDWIGFSQDGKTLVTSANDKTIKLWSTASWLEVASLNDPELRAHVMAFSPDGRALLAGRIDGTIRFWRAPPLSEIEPQLARVEHQRLAEEAEEQNQWDSAVCHLDWLVQALPEEGSLRLRRARAYAQLGRWEQAGGDFREALLQLGEEEEPNWWELALVELAAGNFPGYERTCAEVIARFDGFEEPETAHLIASVCVLAPNRVADPELLIRKAGEALIGEAEKIDTLSTLGAALYRAGRFDAALCRLNEAEGKDTNNDAAVTWLFLAMAHYCAGQVDQAQDWLSTATRWMDQAIQPQCDHTFLPWHRLLQLRILRREAEELLAEK